MPATADRLAVRPRRVPGRIRQAERAAQTVHRYADGPVTSRYFHRECCFSAFFFRYCRNPDQIGIPKIFNQTDMKLSTFCRIPARRIAKTGICTLSVLLGTGLFVSAQTVTDRFAPLPAGAVRLTNFLENDIRNSIEHWNKGELPYREFVEFFRSQAAPQFALGEMWGKAVRSGCMFYRYTQDPELKSILKATVEDLLSVQNPNGSISCTPEEQQPGGENGDLWERKYVMLGLDEYYRWVEQNPAVLEALKKHADCLIAQIGHAPKTEIVDLGWSATNIGHEACHIESSTLQEPFMRLYNWTGEQRYLDFASYIVESGGTKHFDLIQQACDNTLPYKMSGHYPKAYEMMSMFEGVVEYYRATGDERCKQAFMNLYDNIRKNEITIIGNAGADQPTTPTSPGRRGATPLSNKPTPTSPA
ncbi:hypothetical protein DW082_06390 [Alistipes sp. AF48-12]|nr:hypothetical protein DW082_06390 [Alistipes sp. AF48-12]